SWCAGRNLSTAIHEGKASWTFPIYPLYHDHIVSFTPNYLIPRIIMPGTLYLVSTPIGNLEDLTFRAIRILRDVHFIAAENPQVTKLLLDHYAIETPMTTYHQLNKEEKTPLILKRLQDGNHAALVCDAGTPVIADPGALLISKALAAGITVSSVPGPCAIMAALSSSGLPSDEFVFLGMFPQRLTARRRFAVTLDEETRTAILFISVKQLPTALELLYPILGRRRIVAANNLTTGNEAVSRGRVSELLERFSRNPLEGEVTLIIEGSRKKGTDGV
ncbi:MAG TPA: 16S rRNA (cytidine(1402)-2'-O)-methyltransferase, partial [Nitrospiraceae bacterium]|nr:16S rRNA (cytidine(1402)-2'-O)-methyltransferase [Nitrospiraceae bacterium]